MRVVAEAEPAPVEVPSGPMVRLPEPFADFYRREAASVGGLAYVLSGSRVVAEEITQEAFLAAYRRWDEVGGYDRPDAWVRRVAANLAASRIRRLRIEARVMARLYRERREPQNPLPEEDAMFWALVRRLPHRQSQIVVLHYFEDRAVADIANILGCAEGTVKAHLHQARIALSRHLGQIADEENER